jgi:hypothetical protein
MNSNAHIPLLFKMPEALMTAATGPNHPTTNPTAWLSPLIEKILPGSSSVRPKQSPVPMALNTRTSADLTLMAAC